VKRSGAWFRLGLFLQEWRCEEVRGRRSEVRKDLGTRSSLLRHLFVLESC
jgi:hypothetical protein